ncbi:MAG: lysophospholipid acyltransferase family protein [Gemmatimonadales bacterium]
MLRRVLRFVFSRALGLFFRRIEVAGLDQVPATAPTIFAINHPNGLVDPLLLLCAAPRAVSFLGKAPLFSMPVIGWFVKALDTIPVYRRQDDADTTRNRETFTRARALLERGGTIAIAPEGTSHSDPDLRPLKTGAARIALGAGTREPVAIVPVGLFYTDKATFRSSALVLFGEPLVVASVTSGTEPPAAEVEAITRTLVERIRSLVVRADRQEALTVATRAERILTAALPDPKARSVEEIREVRQRLADGYLTLRDGAPTLLARFVRRMDRLERAFRMANLDPTNPVPPPAGAAAVLRAATWLLLRIVIFLPLALPGLVLHLPGYFATGVIAPRVAGGHDDVLATIKLIGAALFYPLTWLATGILVGLQLGPAAGLLAGLFLAPMSGYAALKLVERFDRFVSGTRAFGLSLFERDHFDRLVSAREEFRRDLLTLERRLGDPGTPTDSAETTTGPA